MEEVKEVAQLLGIKMQSLQLTGQGQGGQIQGGQMQESQMQERHMQERRLKESQGQRTAEMNSLTPESEEVAKEADGTIGTKDVITNVPGSGGLVSVEVFGEEEAIETSIKTEIEDHHEKQTNSLEIYEKPMERLHAGLEASTKRRDVDEEEDLNQRKKMKLLDAALNNLKVSKSPQIIEQKACKPISKEASEASPKRDFKLSSTNTRKTSITIPKDKATVKMSMTVTGKGKSNKVMRGMETSASDQHPLVPAGKKPATMQPSTKKSGTTKTSTKFGATKSGIIKPGNPKIGNPKSGTTKSGTTKFATPKSYTTKSGTSKFGTPKSGNPKSNITKFGHPKSGTTKSSTAKPGTTKLGTPKSSQA